MQFSSIIGKRQLFSFIAFFALFSTILSLFFIKTEAFEIFYEFSRKHESWQLDEYVLVFFSVLLSVSLTALLASISLARRLLKDIDQRKLAESQLRTARDEALFANKAKTDMIANMNHELRTPLNAIIGFSEMMKQETFGPLGNDTYKEYLNDIHQSGEHLLGVVNDILDVSAIEAGELELNEEHVSIPAIIDASIRLIQARADKKQVIVSHNISSEFPQIYADERRMKQVVLNLLSNAVKFTRQGGEISVSSWLEDDGSVAVDVADTGLGMDEEEVKIALTRFGQVDGGLNRKVQEGTGLGLPLSEGLIEALDGSLEIKSEKGKGTMVMIRLPKERVVHNV